MGESSQRNDKSRGLLADFGWESQEGYNKRTREYQHECMELGGNSVRRTKRSSINNRCTFSCTLRSSSEIVQADIGLSLWLQKHWS